MAAFPLKSQLPASTQKEIDRIQAITSTLRNVTEVAFLVSLAPYLTNEVMLEDVNDLILMAAGNTLPTGLTGFKKSALFIKKDASGNGLYLNTGDETSAAWDLVDQASTTNIDDGAITMAKLADLANNLIIGRVAGTTGVPKGLSATEVRTLLNVADGANNYVHPNHTGDVTSVADGATVLAKLPTGTPVNAVASRGTLTVTGGGTQIANNDTVTIDVKVYTFKTALTPTEGEVLIGVSDTTALANLLAAINHTGTPDTDYKCAAVHPTVTGISSNATTLIVEAKTKGVAGNSIASTEVAAQLSWDAVTLGTTVAGVDGTVGTQWKPMVDTSYLYVAIATNTIADANWRRVALGNVY